ncbi:MAG: protein translocase subunit SecF [Spirochaetota bacterium]
MFDFSKYKKLSLSFSGALIVLFFLITQVVHGGFAHSLDFNGGLRTTIKVGSSTDRSKLEAFFKQKDIAAVIIFLSENDGKTNYQIDVGLGEVAKIKKLTANLTPVLPKVDEVSQEEPAKKEGDTPPTEGDGKSVENPAPQTVSKKRSDVDELILLLKNGLKLADEDVLSADQVGAVVGDELSSTGFKLLLWTLFIITLYLSFRFQFKFALGASIAVLHDLIICIAFIGAFQIKPSVPIIAALLTIIGYSINDTIVIFDRIRENTPEKVKVSFSSIINKSITQTITRTVNTSVATLISVVALIIGGASELYDFAYVLVFGVFIGTYSSIFIAAPVVELYNIFLERNKGKVTPKTSKDVASV